MLKAIVCCVCKIPATLQKMSYLQGVLEKNVFYQIFSNFATSPPPAQAAICLSENRQPLGVTEHLLLPNI